MTFKLHKDFIMAVSKLWKVTKTYNVEFILAALFTFIIICEREII